MTCSRCGAEAAIRRDAAYYCGKCAVARDWGDVIAMVQDGPRTSTKVVFEPDSDHPGAPDAEDGSAAVNAKPGADGDPFAS